MKDLKKIPQPGIFGRKTGAHKPSAVLNNMSRNVEDWFISSELSEVSDHEQENKNLNKNIKEKVVSKDKKKLRRDNFKINLLNRRQRTLHSYYYSSDSDENSDKEAILPLNNNAHRNSLPKKGKSISWNSQLTTSISAPFISDSCNVSPASSVTFEDRDLLRYNKRESYASTSVSSAKSERRDSVSSIISFNEVSQESIDFDDGPGHPEESFAEDESIQTVNEVSEKSSREDSMSSSTTIPALSEKSSRKDSMSSATTMSGVSVMSSRKDSMSSSYTTISSKYSKLSHPSVSAASSALSSNYPDTSMISYDEPLKYDDSAEAPRDEKLVDGDDDDAILSTSFVSTKKGRSSFKKSLGRVSLPYQFDEKTENSVFPVCKSSIRPSFVDADTTAFSIKTITNEGSMLQIEQSNVDVCVDNESLGKDDLINTNQNDIAENSLLNVAAPDTSPDNVMPNDEDYDSEPLPVSKTKRKSFGNLLTQSDTEEIGPQRPRSQSQRQKRVKTDAELKIYQKGGLKEIEENGLVVRRSNRMKYKPLEYWRNEHVKFGRRKSGPFPVPVIQEIIRIPEEPKISVSSGTNKAKKSNEGYDTNIDPVISIINPLNGEPVEKELVHPPVEPKYKKSKNGDFKLARLLSDPFNSNLCAGMMSFTKGTEKPMKNSTNMTTICYVISGEVEVTINGTEILMQKGGSFLIPKGNNFKINAHGSREAKVFFVNERSEPKELDIDDDM